MRISSIRSLAGPNVWSRHPVLEAWLMPESQAGAALRSTHPANLVPEPGVAAADELPQDCCQRLREWWEAASTAQRAAAKDPLRWEESLRHAETDFDSFRTLALGLQALTGQTLQGGWIETQPGSGATCVAIEYGEERLARIAVAMAYRLIWAEKTAALPDPKEAVQELCDCAAEYGYGSTTRAIVRAAEARRIPIARVDDDALLQLGHGARRRLIQGAITGRAGFLAEFVSRDKLLTKRLLRQLRLPTADGRIVRDAGDAWSAACEIGLPVVVKPRNADYGNGVSLDLMTQNEVAEAWRRAREFRPEILVERQLAGVPHRLFIASGQLVAAARREPAQVVGDGRRSVRELIEAANGDPRRGDGPDTPLYPIKIDPPLLTAIARQGLSLESIAVADLPVNLQLDPASCRAEVIVDVTDRVHPDVAAAAIDAVQAVGLDVAGVDVVAVDIARPLEEQGGGILEVNAGPAIYLHRPPQCPTERPVAEAIVGSLFDPGDTGRIPLIAVLGDGEPAALVATTIAGQLAGGARRVGLSGSRGISIGNRKLTGEPADDADGCRTLLSHPLVELAVCELSTASVRSEGLAFDECTVAVLAGARGSDGSAWLTPERAPCGQLLAQSVAADGAVVAGVECAESSQIFSPGQGNLVAVARDVNNAFLAEHRERGARAVFGDGGAMVFVEGERESRRTGIEPQPPAGADSTSPTLEALLAQAVVWSVSG